MLKLGIGDGNSRARVDDWAFCPPNGVSLRQSDVDGGRMLTCEETNRLNRLANAYRQSTGWGGRIRTCECRYQKPVPYHLATPQQAIRMCGRAGAYSLHIRQGKAARAPVDVNLRLVE